MDRISKYPTVEEVKNKIKEIYSVCNSNGWLDRKVMPYGYGVSIRRFIEHDELEKYTSSSLQIVVAELNGLIDIINVWLDR